MTIEPTWRKASYSTDQGNCVELAGLDEHTIGLRDSKHPDAGHITVTGTQLKELLDALKVGSLRL